MSQEFTNEEAKLFLERITPNKDCLYIFQPQGLADILCAGGFSYAAQAKKNKSSTVLIVHELAKSFGIAYENVSKISYIAPQILNAVKKYLDDNDIHETDNFIYGYLDTKVKKNFTVAKGLNLIDYYRKKVFDIPMDTPLIQPIIKPLSDDEINYFNKHYILDKERTIIIAAYVSPKNLAEIKFWNDTVHKLQEKNYIVYTYIEDLSDKPISDTEPLFANCNELCYIADKVKCFIGSHMGILFFLAQNTAAKILAVNKFPAWFWDTSKMFPNSNSRILYLANEFINPIIEATKKDKAIIQLEISHPKINAEDMVYSYDAMLDRIFSEMENF